MKIKFESVVFGAMLLLVSAGVITAIPDAIDQMFYENYEVPVEKVDQIESNYN